MKVFTVEPSTLLDRLEAAMWPAFLWGILLALPAFLILRSKMLPRTKQFWLEGAIMAWIGGTVVLTVRTPDWSMMAPHKNWIGAFWSIGVVASLMVWAITIVVALAKVSRAKTCGLPVAGWVREESAKLGFKRPPAVRTLSGAEGLLVACVGNTVLVSPDFPGDLDEEQARAVLRHELGHVAGSHWLRWMTISGLQSLIFWHPVGWWLCQQLQIEREMECDDVAREGAALPYAEALLRIGKTRQSMLHLSLGGLAATRRWKRLPNPVAAPSKSDAIRTQLVVACAFGLSLFAASPIFATSESKGEGAPISFTEANRPPLKIVVGQVQPGSGGVVHTEAFGTASASGSGFNMSSAD